MPPRAKKLKLEPLGSILEMALKKQKIPLNLENKRLRGLWDRAVGPQIAAQTRPESVKRNILYVKVFSSAWLQQLHFLKEELLGKVLPLFEEEKLQKIHFSLGEALPVIERKKDNAPVDFDLRYLKERDKKLMEESLAAISDEELREIIRRVMMKEIIRRRTIEKRSPR